MVYPCHRWMYKVHQRLPGALVDGLDYGQHDIEGNGARTCVAGRFEN